MYWNETYRDMVRRRFGLKDGQPLEQLIANAMERFNALSPDEKRKHREAQRKSWVVGETMLAHPEMTREEAEALYERVVNQV